jgi:hypothetical protein
MTNQLVLPRAVNPIVLMLKMDAGSQHRWCFASDHAAFVRDP